MKTVIVGFGRIANSIRHDPLMAKRFPYASHAQILSEHPAFDWVGVADPDVLAQQEARGWGIPHVGTLDAVLNECKPEFAVIATPPDTRLGIVRKMPGLKAVMVEKPLGKDGRKFLDFCKKKNIAVTVNFWRRGVEDLRSLDLRSEIGTPQVAFCTYGNGVLNNGSHLLDFLRMLFGDIETARPVSAMQPIRTAGCSGPLDDYTGAFTMTMMGCRNVMVAPVDFDDYREVGVDVWGMFGRIAFYQETLKLFRYPVADHRAMRMQKEIASDRPKTSEIDASHGMWNLYSAIAEGKSLSPGEEAWKAEAVLRRLIR